MNGILPDIPRFYTAFAEWAACIVYISVMGKRFKLWKVGIVATIALIIQSCFLELTKDLPIGFWIICMAGAVLLMFLFIYGCCNVSSIEAGYSCIRAFVAAEFVASLEWQVYYFLWKENQPIWWKSVGLLLAIYGGVYLILWWLEKIHRPVNGRLDIHFREFGSAAIIMIAVFAISNLSFVTAKTPFSGMYATEIFNIRSIVDLGGIAILYAHHIQCCDLRIRYEMDAMQNIFKNQYLQYQQAKESIEMINFKYHDLKHQIAALRAEKDTDKRNAYLTQMEEEIKSYEAQNKTGNSVVDTVLTSKSLFCIKNDIALTCVVDGALLNNMNVMDICTIFGNALDNAIECEQKIEDKEKRLIHVAVFSQKNFLIMRFENYCEKDVDFVEHMPITTKKQPEFHGYGLKSIRSTVQKYGGAVSIKYEKNWFELKILIPIQE